MSSWQIKKLEEIAFIERGRFSARPRNDPQYYSGNIPFIQTGDVANANGSVTNYRQTLNEKGLMVSKIFPRDSLVITIAANIGDVAKVNFNFACPDSLVIIQPHGNIDTSWLKYLLESKKSYFESCATQNAQANINLQIIKPLKIRVPLYEEQKIISCTLQTWDTAIEKTEMLIAAKEKQFDWLKYRLLLHNPKANHWEIKRLNDFIKESKNLHGKKTAIVAAIGKRGIRDRSEIYSKELSKSYTYNKLVEKNNIAFGLANDAIVYGVNLLDKTYSVSSAYKVFSISKCDSAFLKYFLDANNRKFSLRYLITSARQGKSLDFQGFLNKKIKFPLPVEQKTIAHTLNTARQEIDILKILAKQYRTQKRGLMQKLLTGKWRVKI